MLHVPRLRVWQRQRQAQDKAASERGDTAPGASLPFPANAAG